MQTGVMWRSRAVAVALTALVAGAAHAGWSDLGTVTLTNDWAPSLGEGSVGGSYNPIYPTDPFDFGGNGYNYYAGTLLWNGGTIQTLCSSMGQEFGVGSMFTPTTEEYALTNTLTSGAGSIRLGDGTVVGLPSADVGTGGYSSTSFIHAAELFGGLGGTVVTAQDAAALQIAIWETLYPTYGPGTVFNGNTALQNEVNLDLSTHVGWAQLADVDWYDYTNTTNGSNNGQGQFGYNPNGGGNIVPGSTPGPMAAMIPAVFGLTKGWRLRRRRA